MAILQAPESLQTSTYSPQSDVWSFAIVVYEIVSRSEPHFDEDPMSVGFRIRDEGLVPTIPDDCDAFLKELMLSCWHSDPSQRPVSVASSTNATLLTVLFQTFDHICESIKSHQNV
jgi:serine/threonine protein kinase